jgi:outer membrane protein OmpA-like peptidoglycan-associated protein
MSKIAKALCLSVLAGMVLLAGGRAQAQQTPSQSQILDALKQKPQTRGLTRSLSGGGQAAPVQSAEEKRFIDGLRTRSLSRAISVEEREKVVEIVKDKPKIDLEITFEYDSAAIQPKSIPILVNLGRALSDPELKGAVFLVGGHTDAKGSDGYNLSLSERRAAAVKQYLGQHFGIPHDSLVVVGFGKEHLKITADPYAEANRRVQVVNMAK